MEVAAVEVLRGAADIDIRYGFEVKRLQKRSAVTMRISQRFMKKRTVGAHEMWQNSNVDVLCLEMLQRSTDA